MTNGIAVYAYLSNTAQPATPTFVGDISASSPLCVNAADGSRTCTLSVAAPIGQDTFTVLAYDQVPLNGVPQGNLLSTDSIVFTVAAGVANTLPLVLNGVPTTLVLSPSGYIVPVGQPATFSFNVNAKDADGSYIIGQGYYTSPVGLAVSGDPNGTLSLSTTLVTNPAASSVTVAFNGGALPGTATITATASGAVGSTMTVQASANAPQVTIAVPGRITEFPLSSANADPAYLLAGPDGNVWFTEQGADKIGRITPYGTLTEFPIGRTGAGLNGITIGPDGNIWYAESNASKIGRMTLTGTVIGEYPVSTSSPVSLVNDVAGGTGVWFTDQTNMAIGNVTAGGIVQLYALAPGSTPGYIIADPSSTLLFTLGQASAIGTITPTAPASCTSVPCTAGQTIVITTPTANSGPNGVTVGPDGNIWFVEYFAGKLARYVWGQPFLTQNLDEFTIPTAGSRPFAVAGGSDGEIWFTESAGNKIGAFNRSGGSFTEYPVPTAVADPFDIISGPDGNIWFTEEGVGKIGRVQL